MAEDIVESLDSLLPFMAARDYDGMEEHARQLCSRMAGEEIALRISKIDLDAYQAQLSRGADLAVPKALASGCKAVYFEYNMDSDWYGMFFLCPEYAPVPTEPEYEDWPSDWTGEVPVGDLKDFASLFDSSFDKTSYAVGVNTYLIARTQAAFGRACSLHFGKPIAICIGYHDQDMVTRAYEP